MAGLGHICRCDTTPPHPTFGACLRAKRISVGYCKSHLGQDYSADKRWTRDLAAYADARRQGIQPESTRRRDVDASVRLSDERGEAYGADLSTASPSP